MTNGTTTVLKHDPIRLQRLEKSVEEFRALFGGKNGPGKALKFIKHQFHNYYFVSPPHWRIALRMLSVKQRVPPDFVSTGAVRSGTSTMSSYIFQHPCVALPLSKELTRVVPNSRFVLAQFPKKSELEVIRQKYGVAKTGTGVPIAPSISWPYLAKALNPDIRFVVVLRNPVDRVLSHWRWDKMIQRPMAGDPLWSLLPQFNDAMHIEMEHFHCGGCGWDLISGAARTGYLRHSVYLPFLKNLCQLVGREKVLVLNANNMFTNPIPQVKKVYAFLGLPDYDPVVIKDKNASPPIPLDATTRDELVDFFKPINQALYEFLDEDYGWQ